MHKIYFGVSSKILIREKKLFVVRFISFAVAPAIMEIAVVAHFLFASYRVEECHAVTVLSAPCAIDVAVPLASTSECTVRKIGSAPRLHDLHVRKHWSAKRRARAAFRFGQPSVRRA